MSRTNIDLDDEAVEDVMRTYEFTTKREAVNFALNKVRRPRMTVDEVLAMRGRGWAGDIDEIKRSYLPDEDRYTDTVIEAEATGNREIDEVDG